MNRPHLLFITKVLKPIPHYNLRFRHKKKVIWRQTFNFHAYGGSQDKTLAAALKRRDKIAHSLHVDLDQYWKDCHTKDYRYVQQKGARNTSGVVGVTYWDSGRAKYWKASICLTKYKETVKSFNCGQYGPDEAFRLAVEWRQAMEHKLSTLSQAN
jgi:hypothetical protein